MKQQRVSASFVKWASFMPICLGLIASLLIGCMGSPTPRNPMETADSKGSTMPSAFTDKDIAVLNASLNREMDPSTVAPCETCTTNTVMRVWHAPDVPHLTPVYDDIATVKTVSYGNWHDDGSWSDFNSMTFNCQDGTNPTPPDGPTTTNDAGYLTTLREEVPDNLSIQEHALRITYVKVAQTILRLRGYDVGPSDGEFGPRTRRAVASFQRDRGVIQTGVIDSGTWTILLSDFDRYEEADAPTEPGVPEEMPNDDEETFMPGGPVPTDDPFANNPDLVGDASREIARLLVGLTEDDAETIIKAQNIVMREKVKTEIRFEIRVRRRDSQDFPGLDDYRLDRINLVIEEGRVISASVG